MTINLNVLLTFSFLSLVTSNNVVTFDGKLYKSCKGMNMLIKWNGYHNLQETTAVGYDSCSPTENVGAELHAYESSGFEKIFTLDSLRGQTRYFVCSSHCSSGAKFKVTCPAEAPQCVANYEPKLVNGFVKCVPCRVGFVASGTEQCKTWYNKYLKDITVPDMPAEMIKLLNDSKSQLQEGKKRRNVRSMLLNMRKNIANFTKRRLSVDKDTLTLSADFQKRLVSRGSKVDLIIPTTKTKLQSSLACDEEDVNIDTQLLPYEVFMQENETSLVCREKKPLTKLFMKRDGALHNQTRDIYEASCWNTTTSTWYDTKQLLDGESYVCKKETYFVNSLSGVTCNSSDPVSSADLSTIVGTDSCGIIGEGFDCTDFVCNENYIVQSAPNCSTSGYTPAVCHCSTDFVEVNGTCNLISTTEAPTTTAPTEALTTAAPTTTTTTAVPTTTAPTTTTTTTTVAATEAPTTTTTTTEVPTTSAPTKAPTTAALTEAPTEAPTTAAPTTTTTAAPTTTTTTATASPKTTTTTAAPTSKAPVQEVKETNSFYLIVGSVFGILIIIFVYLLRKGNQKQVKYTPLRKDLV